MSVYKKSNPEKFITIPTPINNVVGGGGVIGLGNPTEVRETVSAVTSPWYNEDDVQPVVNTLTDNSFNGDQLIRYSKPAGATQLEYRNFQYSWNIANNDSIDTIYVAIKYDAFQAIGGLYNFDVPVFAYNGVNQTATVRGGASGRTNGSSFFSSREDVNPNLVIDSDYMATVILNTPLTGSQLKNELFTLKLNLDATQRFPIYAVKIFPKKP